MNSINTKSRFLFATGIVLTVVFAVLLLTATPTNAATEWHIKDDATGGDCSLIGNWDTASKTCTLSQDLSQGIIIDSNNVILDGDGHTITGTGSNTDKGVFLYQKTGVTVKNLNIKKFVSYGIYLNSSSGNTLKDNNVISNGGVGGGAGILLYSSSNNTLLDNTASSNASGIFVYYFSYNNTIKGSIVNSNNYYGIALSYNIYNNTLVDNTISSDSWNGWSGIWLDLALSNTLTGNIVSGSQDGIVLERSSSNTITDNTVNSNRRYGIALNYSNNNNKIYNNNFINNPKQAYISGGSGNAFNLSSPTGGNYWNNFDEPLEGCNDLNQDNFCDLPYIFNGGQDNLPWTKKDGWLVPQNQPPTLSYSQNEGFVDVGINPDEGDTNTNFTFKIVYTDADNDSPTDIRTIVFDGTPSDAPAIEISTDAMILDSSASPELRDGNYANGEQYSLTKLFPTGIYRYRFQASDGGIGVILDGVAGGKEQRFTVNENEPPLASFTFEPSNPAAGEEVFFDASASSASDTNGRIILYEWDFDADGDYDYSFESPTVSVRWPLGGSYDITLRVTDDKGGQADFTTLLVIKDTPQGDLAGFIALAFKNAANTQLWKDILLDSPFKVLFPSYRKFEKIDKWLREDVNGSVSGSPLDWLKEDQRFADFAPYVTAVDIVTLLEEQIPETNMSYAGRIKTVISEYRLADYALLRDQDTSIGLKQAAQTFKQIGEQLVRWIPLVGDLIAGDPVDEALLKETIKAGTKVAMAEMLIRKGFEETHAANLSGSGVNLAWLAYKTYAGIRDLDNTAKLQTYENRLAAYFACLQRGPGLSGGGDHPYCWQQARQDDESAFSSVLADEDEEEFKNMWERYGTDWGASGVSTAKLEELQNAVKEAILDALQQYKQKFPDRLIVDINSPVEIRVIDSRGAIAGVVDGSVKNEIPYSVYDGESETVTIILPSDGSSFELVGTADGTYGVTIMSVQEGVVLLFEAIDIPIKVNGVHKYTVDWGEIQQNGNGVILHIDADGDKVFEKEVVADSTLTRNEFILQTETKIDIDPDTLNLKSKGVITAYIELPRGFVPENIDRATIMLNGAVPSKEKPTVVGDYDNDGTTDLMVKFDREKVRQLLLDSGQVAKVRISGKVFYDGGDLDFAGVDYVRLIR